MYRVTSIHGDEFMAFKPRNGGDAKLVHLSTRIETTISDERFAEFAELTVDFVDDPDGMREAFDDGAASIMIEHGLLAWDDWEGMYRAPEDIAADVRAAHIEARERDADNAAYRWRVL